MNNVSLNGKKSVKIPNG